MQVCGSLTISDQEAEVAEALFVLASGMASQLEAMGPKAKAQVTGDCSPSKPSSTVVSATIHNSGKHSTADYSSPHAKDAAGPVAEGILLCTNDCAKQISLQCFFFYVLLIVTNKISLQ